MLPAIEKTIRDHRLLSPGDKIIVAVSGGPDSTALLLVLHQLAPRYHWKLIAAHVNYHSRGADSARDETFVRQLAKKVKIPVVVKSVRLDRHASNFEERARGLRYSFFEAIAKKHRANKIAVAHTADDQVETMILNMLRGSGLRGAAGMPVKRDLVVRPLLGVRREEVLRWLRRQKQSYRTDRSNRDLKYQRNWIRWKLIPYLRSSKMESGFRPPASPGSVWRAGRDASRIGHPRDSGKWKLEEKLEAGRRLFDRAAAFLERQAEVQLRRLKISEQDGATKYQLAPFLALPEILQGEMIRELLGRRDITQTHVAEVLAVLRAGAGGKKKMFKGRTIIKLRGTFAVG